MNKKRVLQTQESVEATSLVYDLNEFKADGEAIEFDPCRAVRFNVEGTYQVFFAGRTDVGIIQFYDTGEIEESSVVKITDVAGDLVEAGNVFIYY